MSQDPAGAPEFDLRVGQNPFLSPADPTVDAVITVRGGGGAAPAAAEVLLVDCSQSMEWPPTKIAAARVAGVAAVDALRDGVLFAVVQGTERAAMVYPATAELVPANERTRAQARAAVRALVASGGTAMSTWLRLARELFAPYPDHVKHAILLTDGLNQSESAQRLTDELTACAGRFCCDARGIGDDWDPREIRRITGVLRGAADAVVDDGDLATHFTDLIDAAMGKVVADVRLRITTMPGARVVRVEQRFPTQVDLTDDLVADGDRVVEVTTGAWGAETREFMLTLADTADALSYRDKRQRCRIDLVDAKDRAVKAGPVPVFAMLTADPTVSEVVYPSVLAYRAQDELRDALDAGWDAFTRHDAAAVEQHWGTAVRIATEVGNDELLHRLARVLDIDNAAAGRVRMRPGARLREGSSVFLGPTTLPGGEPVDAPAPAPAGAALLCPAADCTHLSPPGAPVCTLCGTRFPAP